MENTKISWATHSFSPWIGCSKVHTGCKNCYAAAMSGRLGVTWGAAGTRRRTAVSTWKQVERWNRQAACCCRSLDVCDADDVTKHLDGCPQRDRPRVFPSLCDPFEDWRWQVLGSGGKPIYVPLCGRPRHDDPADHRQLLMADVRRDFFALIDLCPNLDFLLLTKRPENIPRMVPMHWAPASCGGESRQPRNVWLLYSASDQASLEAGLPHLLACRDLAPVLGLSLEPLVGPVDLDDFLEPIPPCPGWPAGRQAVSWVIVGGESGPKARPMEISWLESIAEQCGSAGVPLFVKQDAGLRAGQQGRIPEELWKIKRFPVVLT